MENEKTTTIMPETQSAVTGCPWDNSLSGEIKPPPPIGAVPPSGDLCEQRECGHNTNGMCDYD